MQQTATALDPTLAEWLEDLGLGHLKPEMVTQNIDSTILAFLSHDQLQQVGVLKMGDRIKLIRRATERARELQASGGAPKMKNDKIEHDSASAADFLSEDNRMAAPIVQTLTDSRGISTPAAFYDTFLAHGRKPLGVLQCPSADFPECCLCLEDTLGSFHIESSVVNSEGIVMINYSREGVSAYKRSLERLSLEHLCNFKWVHRVSTFRDFVPTSTDEMLALKMRFEGCYLLRCREVLFLSSQRRMALANKEGVTHHQHHGRAGSTGVPGRAMITADDIEDKVVRSLERAVALLEILESRLSLMHTFSKVLSDAHILKSPLYSDCT